MKFESMYERLEPGLNGFAEKQGGIITLGQLKLLIMREFGSDKRTLEAKVRALQTFQKIAPDAEPGQFIFIPYRPKRKAVPDNGGGTDQ